MRNLTKIVVGRSRAISPVISVLLMIAVAVAASLVAYAWVMGYMGFTTSKVNEAIQIQGMATDPSGKLVVWVQNVGQGIVSFNPSGSVYLNDNLLQGCNFQMTALNQGSTARVDTTQTIEPDEQVKVRIVTIDGTSTEMVNNRPLGSATAINFPIFTDNFDSGFIHWTAWNGGSGTETVQSSIYGKTNVAEFSKLATANDFAAEYYDLASPQTPLYCRAYVMVTALPASGDYIQISPNIADSYKGADVVTVWIYNNAGTYEWALRYKVNGGSQTYVFSATPTPQINTWYSVEIGAISGAGNGEAHLYINGAEVASETGLTNNNYSLKNVYMNIYSNGALAVTSYVDDVVVKSTYIGP